MKYSFLKKTAPVFIVSLLIFFLYVSTAPPSVYLGDSGETITVSHTLGIQHPPGYPLFSLMAHMAPVIPAGDISFRYYLFSSFLALLCFFALYYTSIKIFSLLEIKNPPPGAVFAPPIMLALGCCFWHQAITAKGGIYVLNLLFFILLFNFLLSYHAAGAPREKRKHLFLFSLLFGLSLGNHLMLQLVLLPAYLFIILRSFSRLDFPLRTLLFSAFFFAAGAAVYIYLPARGGNALLNWGEPTNLNNFLKILTRWQYVRSEIARSVMNPVHQSLKFFSSIAREFLYAGFFVSILGGYFVFKKNRSLFCFLLAPPALLWLVISFYLNLPEDKLYLIENYIIPAYLPLSLLSGTGIYFISSFLKTRLNLSRKKISLFLVAALAAAQIACFYPENNKNNYFFAHDYNKNVLNSLDPGTILFAIGDGVVFPLWYLKFVKHYRPDVTVIGTPLLPMKWVRDNIKRQNSDITVPLIKTKKIGNESTGKIINYLIMANYSRFPVYFTYNKPEKNSLSNNIKIMPKGLVHRAVSSDYYFATQKYIAALKNIWKFYNLRGVFFPDKYTADAKTKRLYLKDYAISANTAGVFFEEQKIFPLSYKYFRQAAALDPKDHEFIYNAGNSMFYMKNYSKAAALYKKSVSINPSYDKGWYNLGVTHFTAGNYKKALKAFLKVKKINPDWRGIDSDIRAVRRATTKKNSL